MTFYVSSEKGNDNNDGTSLTTSLATIAKAIEKVTEASTIYIDEGTYNITSVKSLSSSKGKIIIKSLYTDLNKIPTFVVDTTPLNSTFSGNLDIYDIKFIASDTLSGDTRIIIYTNDTYVVNFYNCLFSVSKNGSYPTTAFFYFHNNTNTYRNKNFYNCSFDAKSKALPTSGTGIPKLYNCATTYTGTTDKAQYNDCVKGVTYDEKYHLISYDNTLYGVYSGSYAWVSLLCLIYSDKNYYSIKSDYYDEDNGTYIPLTEEQYTDGMFPTSDLFKEITVDSELFKPIDKFDSFKLCTIEKTNFILSGIKSLKELIVGKTSFLTTFAENIDYFQLTNESNDLGTIKLAFSIDDGVTWKTYNFETSQFVDLMVDIPKSDYNDFSSDDLTNWNNAVNEIYTNGIDAASLSNIDFNSLMIKKIKFAYVISAVSPSSLDKIKNLIWQFDAKGSMKLCQESDVDIFITETGVKVESKIDNDILRTNILYDDNDE